MRPSHSGGLGRAGTGDNGSLELGERSKEELWNPGQRIKQNALHI